MWIKAHSYITNEQDEFARVTNPSLIHAKLLPRQRGFPDAEVDPPIRGSVRDERRDDAVEGDVLQDLDGVTPLKKLDVVVVDPATGHL